jgi:Fur family transcriptional regulator, peroxide stress response regulator
VCGIVIILLHAHGRVSLVNKKDQTRRIQHFVEQCKAARLKVTPQRLVIYRALLQDGTHPSPDKLYRTVRKSHPTISHATVYATLEALERHGIIARLTPLHETVRFDPILEPHHHVVCVRCKKVANFNDAELDSLTLPKSINRNGTVLGYTISVHIVCSECRRGGRGG